MLSDSFKQVMRLCGLLIPCVLFLPVIAAADVQVTGFNDMNFGSWGGSGDMVQTDDVCVYNTVDTNYIITATGSGGSFALTSGGHNLNYEVRFKTIQLSNGTPSSFAGANTASPSCSGGTNAQIEVTVRESALAAAVSGSYSANLTILVEPGP